MLRLHALSRTKTGYVLETACDSMRNPFSTRAPSHATQKLASQNIQNANLIFIMTASWEHIWQEQKNLANRCNLKCWYRVLLIGSSTAALQQTESCELKAVGLDRIVLQMRLSKSCERISKQVACSCKQLAVNKYKLLTQTTYYDLLVVATSCGQACVTEITRLPYETTAAN